MAFFLLFMSLLATVTSSPVLYPRGPQKNPGTLRLPLSGTRGASPLSKRQTHQSTLYNQVDLFGYTVELLIGSPRQSVNVQIDTGSTDTWVFGPGACTVGSIQEEESPSYESAPEDALGCGGGFDPTLSSTYLLFNSSSNFSTVYVDETTVEGTYFLDTLCIGDACIFSQVMALATEASDRVWRGILGLGLITQESATFSGNSYPTILDTLVRQGVIGARAYSVWLDDYQSSTGSLLLGGYDESKFVDSLTTFPIQSATDGITSLAIELTSIALSDASGTPVTYTSADGSLPDAADLDTGTTYTYIPSDIFTRIAEALDVITVDIPGQSPVYYIDCNTGQGQVDFTFANPITDEYGESEPLTISIPLSELVLPSLDAYNPNQCVFGIQPDYGTEGTLLLGDTFLRSAYVLFDIDNQRISLAQTNTNPTGPEYVVACPDGVYC